MNTYGVSFKLDDDLRCISRVLREEWEKREELERLQEEQRLLLEQEREKRKEFEIKQREKENQLLGKL